jgi:hypothetical protein
MATLSDALGRDDHLGRSGKAKSSWAVEMYLGVDFSGFSSGASLQSSGLLSSIYKTSKAYIYKLSVSIAIYTFTIHSHMT